MYRLLCLCAVMLALVGCKKPSDDNKVVFDLTIINAIGGAAPVEVYVTPDSTGPLGPDLLTDPYIAPGFEKTFTVSYGGGIVDIVVVLDNGNTAVFQDHDPEIGADNRFVIQAGPGGSFPYMYEESP